MSVDLQLLIPIHGTLDGPACCHTVIDLDTDYDVWEAIKALPCEPLPDRGPDAKSYVSSYFARREDGESEYGDVVDDAYGDALRWARAGDLAVTLESKADPESVRTRAAAGYLAALPEGWPVVLYWH
jgi:hypothetical protein